MVSNLRAAMNYFNTEISRALGVTEEAEAYEHTYVGDGPLIPIYVDLEIVGRVRRQTPIFTIGSRFPLLSIGRTRSDPYSFTQSYSCKVQCMACNRVVKSVYQHKPSCPECKSADVVPIEKPQSIVEVKT